MAWSRNQPRRRLAWLIVLVVLALIALAAKVNAASRSEDPVAVAIQYADALSGGSDSRRAPALDEDNDEDSDEDDGNDAAEDAEAADPAEDAETGDADGAETGDADAAEVGDAEDAAAPGIDALDRAGDADAIGALDAGEDPASDPAGGALAMLDSELDPGDDIAGSDAADAAAAAGSAEQYEAALRHRRPSRWGRLDVGVSWRTRWTEPMHAPANRYDELWLVATWRR